MVNNFLAQNVNFMPEAESDKDSDNTQDLLNSSHKSQEEEDLELSQSDLLTLDRKRDMFEEDYPAKFGEYKTIEEMQQSSWSVNPSNLVDEFLTQHQST